MSGNGVISFGDIQNHLNDSGKKSSPQASQPSAGQQEKNAETVLTLKTELGKAYAQLDADIKAPKPTNPQDIAALQARIERTKADIASLSRELVRAGEKNITAPEPGAVLDESAASNGTETTTTTPGKIDTTKIDDYLGGDQHSGMQIPDVDRSHVLGAGAVAGGIYGARRTPAESGLIMREMEVMNNLPKGALSEVAAAQNPSRPITTQQAANAVADRINARSTAMPPVPPMANAESMAPVATNNRIGPGQGASAIFNYGIEHGLSPTQAAQAIDNTKQPSGVHDILQNEVRPGVLKTRELFPMGVTPAANSSLIEAPVTYNTRAEPPAVWRRERAMGPPPWTGLSAPANAPTNATHRAPSTPSAAPQETAPQATTPPLVDPDILTKAANRTRMVQKGINIGAGAVGGGLTALQAYDMAKRAGEGQSPEWDEYLSLLGGPAMMTAGKFLGPLGMIAQLPLAYRKFLEQNPGGVPNPGQYLPESMQSRKP